MSGDWSRYSFRSTFQVRIAFDRPWSLLKITGQTAAANSWNDGGSSSGSLLNHVRGALCAVPSSIMNRPSRVMTSHPFEDLSKIQQYEIRHIVACGSLLGRIPQAGVAGCRREPRQPRECPLEFPVCPLDIGCREALGKLVGLDNCWSDFIRVIKQPQ